LYHRNSKVEGLSTLRDEFTYLEESKNATFKVSATSLRIVGDYDIDVSIVIENEMVDVFLKFFPIGNLKIAIYV